jgi:CHRD domain
MCHEFQFANLMKSLFPAIIATCLVSSASAATLIFTASLNGAQEAPTPVITTGIGTATMTIDDVTGAWLLTGIFSSLLGTANNAHIHGPAPVGVPAGVVKGLTFDSATSGNFSGSSVSTGVYTAGQIADLKGGLHYINIHSTSFGGGEIRGQLVPEPAASILCAAASGLLLRRRR